MAQLEKTYYTVDDQPVEVKTNSSATWFAGLILVLVVLIVGGFALMINNANNETAQELEKMQQEQANIQQSNVAAQEAQQNAVRLQQADTDALQASTQNRQNAKDAELAAKESQLNMATPAPVPAPAPLPNQVETPAPTGSDVGH
ncbi:MAG: hypothetical protein JSS86_20640 [Cyanobacteria bacterium SZAS LIN-2]|nr:hypothetical protein [Cyanobacteria bacterium SZAS LIN-2]MBS2007384.1 hypothetical protein [Cyanobacteria bacterium SZAS TMP-1]